VRTRFARTGGRDTRFSRPSGSHPRRPRMLLLARPFCLCAESNARQATGFIAALDDAGAVAGQPGRPLTALPLRSWRSLPALARILLITNSSAVESLPVHIPTGGP
jgi:hypothetical protein